MERLRGFASCLSPSLVCFFLYLTWQYTVFFSPALLHFGADTADLMVFLVSSLAGLVVALASFGMRVFRGWMFAHARAALSLACILLSIATLFAALFLQNLAAAVGFGLLAGCTSSAMVIAWGFAYERAAPPAASASLPVAGFIASLVLIAAQYLPNMVQTALSVVLPLLVPLVFAHTDPLISKISGSQDSPDSPGSLQKSGVSVSALRGFLLSVLAFGAVYGCFRGLMASGIGADPRANGLLFFAGMGLAAFALSLVRCVRGFFRVESAYRAALPLVIGAIAILLAFPVEVYGVSALFLGAGYALFDMGTWLASVALARRGAISPASFIVVRALIGAGILAGSVLGGQAALGTLPWNIVCLSGIVLLAIAGPLSFVRIEPEPSPAPTAAPDDRPESLSELPRIDYAQLAKPLAREYGLTQREADVLELVLAGCTGAQIEERLSISQSTVKTHMRHIYDKIGVHSRSELFKFVSGMGK